MDTQQIFVIVIIAAALMSVVLVSFLVTTTNTLLLLPANTKTTVTTTNFKNPITITKVQDSIGDAKLIPLYKTDIFPEEIIMIFFLLR